MTLKQHQTRCKQKLNHLSVSYIFKVFYLGKLLQHHVLITCN